MQSGDEFFISNKTFFMQGGIYAQMSGAPNVRLTIDGTLLF